MHPTGIKESKLYISTNGEDYQELGLGTIEYKPEDREVDISNITKEVSFECDIPPEVMNIFNRILTTEEKRLDRLAQKYMRIFNRLKSQKKKAKLWTKMKELEQYGITFSFGKGN